MGSAKHGQSTRKFLVRLKDGMAVETVLIPQPRRNTVCVSTQVGCGRGCRFCATAQMGLGRNLTPAEIQLQIDHAQEAAHQAGLSPPENVVFMGMGEPLDNFDAVRAATESLVAKGFAPRRITVSTVGPSTSRVKRLSEMPRGVRIAWSLVAGTTSLRARLIPTARAGPGALLGAFREVYDGRKGPLFVEVPLIKDVNDGPEHAREIVRLFNGWTKGVRFNLLPLNPVPSSAFSPPSWTSTQAFQSTLRSAGHFCMVRKPRGTEERAACGQLRLQSAAKQ